MRLNTMLAGDMPIVGKDDMISKLSSMDIPEVFPQHTRVLHKDQRQHPKETCRDFTMTSKEK